MIPNLILFHRSSGIKKKPPEGGLNISWNTLIKRLM